MKKLFSTVLIFAVFLLPQTGLGRYVYKLHTQHKELSLVETEYLTFQENGTLIQAGSGYEYTLPFRILQKDKNPLVYEFSSTVEFLEGNNLFFGYKLFFEGGHQFSFLINPNGNFYVSMTPSSAKQFQKLVDWKAFKAIKKGKGAINTLSVAVDKKNIRFLINGKQCFKQSKKELAGKGIKTNGGLAVVKFYTQKDSRFLVKEVSMTVEPEIQKVTYAPSDPSKQPVSFGEAVNQNKYASVAPMVTANEKKVFFARQMEHSRAELTERDDKLEWSKPEVLPYPINREKKSSFIVAANADGTTVYSSGVYENNKYFNGLTEYKIGLDGKWKEGSKSKIDNYKNLNNQGNISLSNDGKYLLTAIDMGNGYGIHDIYVSFRKSDGNFSKPLNLGAVINSAASDFAPFLAPDNITLYFASGGLPGYGNCDIYMSKRLDDTWQNWSTPVNLGTTINTVAWDGYFVTSASGNMGVTANSKGRKHTALYYFELEKAVKPDPVVVLSGIVTDAETQEPILTNVRVTGFKTKNTESVITNPQNGKYSLVLLKGEKYEIIAEKEGYYPVSELVDLTTIEEFAEVEKNLQLVKIKVGQVVRLNNIFFDFAKSTLMEESFEELNRLVKLMQDNPEMKIRISGHTDGIGSTEGNLKLSQERSESVVGYLQSKGISPERLQAKGHGKSKPVATNDTEEGRALNRRVEFEILE